MKLNTTELSVKTGRSKSWIFKKVSERSIPVSREFGRLVFDWDEVQKWMESNTIRVKTEKEIIDEAQKLLKIGHNGKNT